MKTYVQLMNFDKAFNEFLLKIYKKSSVNIEYYQIQDKIYKYNYAFLGYDTNSDGKYGIHYDEQLKSYKFGTFETKVESWIIVLSYQQVSKIPTYIRDAFLDVVVSKKDTIIKVFKKGKNDLNEWI